MDTHEAHPAPEPVSRAEEHGGASSTEQEVYLNLQRAHETLAAPFAKLFREHGISDAQYDVLRVLRRNGGRVPTRKIAAEMVTREPDVTRLIDRLERARLVERERSGADRRVVWIRLASEGAVLLERLDRFVTELHRVHLGQLGADKLRQLNELLYDARGVRPPASAPADDRIQVELL
jgi:DNA-binding MarR family transcriptional regulator